MNVTMKKLVCVAVALVVQCVAIGWLVWRYESIVRGGTEVRFRCEAYDPYDPLRGRYLNTTVRESCTNFVDFAAEKGKTWEFRNRLYAKLEPSTNGLWCVVAVALTPSDDGGLWVKPKRSSVEQLITWSDKGRTESYEDFEKRRERSPLVARVWMPDQLFVNENVASAAEKVLREATSAKGKGAVAVYRVRGGEIVITDIEIAGKSVLALARESDVKGTK